MNEPSAGGIPALGFSAFSGTGKTTLIEALLGRLTARGLRVAVLKHDAHRFEIDREGKDSWRFTHAGAVQTVLCSPEKTVLIEQRPLSLDQAAALVRDVDLLLVEGYRQASLTRIGLCRKATGQGFPDDPRAYAAVVTDLDEPPEGVPCFGFGDAEALTEFILKNRDGFGRLGGPQKGKETVMGYTAAVVTVSDKGARGERIDTSGPALCAMLAEAGYQVVHTRIIPDEAEEIRAELIRCADELRVALTLTTGGTGFSPRDVTPEATLAVVERETRGIPEAMRAESLKLTPRGCLSRAAAGIRGRTLIVNLPGSEKAAKENLAAVLGALGHGLDMLYSQGSADCAAAGD